MRRTRAWLAAVLVAGVSCRQLLGIDTPVGGVDDGATPPPPTDGVRDAPGDAAIDAPGLGSNLEFVEGSSAVSNDPKSAIALNLGGAIQADDLIVVAIGNRGGTIMSIQKVSDTLGSDTYVVGAPLHVANNVASEMLFAVATEAGTDHVTVSFGNTPSFVDLRVAVYRGANVLDAAATNDGKNGDARVSIMTTHAGDLVVGADYSVSPTTGPGAGLEARELTGLDDILEDELAAAAGDYDVKAVLAGDGDWVMQACAFVVTPAP